MFRLVPQLDEVLAGVDIAPGVLALLVERDRQLEDYLDSMAQEAVFSHAGTPTTAASARWYPARSGTLREVVVSLATAGSTDTVVTVYRNGVSIGTVTLGSGVNKNTGTFDDVLAADIDWLTVAATTVGTGAEDLTVQARFS